MSFILLTASADYTEQGIVDKSVLDVINENCFGDIANFIGNIISKEYMVCGYGCKLGIDIDLC